MSEPQHRCPYDKNTCVTCINYDVCTPNPLTEEVTQIYERLAPMSVRDIVVQAKEFSRQLNDTATLELISKLRWLAVQLETHTVARIEREIGA